MNSLSWILNNYQHLTNLLFISFPPTHFFFLLFKSTSLTSGYWTLNFFNMHLWLMVIKTKQEKNPNNTPLSLKKINGISLTLSNSPNYLLNVF